MVRVARVTDNTGESTGADGYVDADRARWIPEEGKNRERSAFERDRARLVAPGVEDLRLRAEPAKGGGVHEAGARGAVRRDRKSVV